MMKARDQQADPMKSPTLGYNAGFGLRAVEQTAAEEVERVYRTNTFGLLHARERWKNRSRGSSLERNKTMYKKLYRRGGVSHREENPYEI